MNAVAGIDQAGNAEAEAVLCGALMCSPHVIDRVADQLSPDDFFDPWLGNLFSVIVKERSLGRTPNPVTLKPYYDGEDYRTLCGLVGSGAQIIAVPGLVEHIRVLAQRRRLLEALHGAIAESADQSKTAHELADIAEAALADLAEREGGETELTAADCARRAIENMDEENSGVRSGLEALDAAWGPLRPKSLNIVAGRPGMGKSATALSYGLGAAKRGHGVLIISLEMSDDEIGERLLADLCFDDERTRIPAAAISSGNCSSEQKRILWRAQSALQDLPIAVVDTSAAKVSKIDRLVRRYARRFAAQGHKLELVIVDYLGLARSDRDRAKTYEEVSDVSRALKDTAKRHSIAMMALHQLSRKVEERKDKRPNQADLRDSGQIEQDADSILFLYAPEYYLMAEEPHSADDNYPAWEAEMARVRGELQFIVAKRRRGPAGVGRGRFYRHYQAVRG